MSQKIPVGFVTHFTANMLVLSQQKPAKLRVTTRPEPIVGDTMFVERLGPKDSIERGARHGETPISDADHTRRKLSMVDYVVPADIIDTDDKLKLLIEPQGPYVRNQVFSLNRRIDDVVIAALGSVAFGGHVGGTSINNYDVGESRIIDGQGDVVDAGGTHSDTAETQLTIDKLLTCKQLLDDAEIDDDRQRYFLCNPFNINQLMNTTEVKSSDFNTVKALSQGQIDTYLGFKFIKSTRLVTSADDTATIKCYAFAQDAIVMAVAQEPKVSIDRRPDLLNSTQVFSELSIGATRVEGPAVVEILLKTTG